MLSVVQLGHHVTILRLRCVEDEEHIVEVLACCPRLQTLRVGEMRGSVATRAYEAMPDSIVALGWGRHCNADFWALCDICEAAPKLQQLWVDMRLHWAYTLARGFFEMAAEERQAVPPSTDDPQDLGVLIFVLAKTAYDRNIELGGAIIKHLPEAERIVRTEGVVDVPETHDGTFDGEDPSDDDEPVCAPC
jgi:hypothetical protein